MSTYSMLDNMVDTNSEIDAPLLFASAGLTSSTASFLASGVSALLMLAITIPAFIFADNKYWGRRLSTISGGIIQCFCMITIGSLYASNSVHAHRGAGRWAVIVLIYIFAITFSATWAVSFRVYVSEIQSPETRAGASSLALSANWVGFLIPNPLLSRINNQFLGRELDCCLFNPNLLS